MRPTQGICATAAVLALTTLTSAAYADGRDWSDGSVINVTSVRTENGHFDDYMHFLATSFKTTMEAAKKAGLILSYRIVLVEPRGPQDPDILLITEYKNWAALDQLGGKMEKVIVQIEGSVDKANQGDSERNKIRTILGSQTEQEALLK